jgi:hypothetical protein
MSQRRVLVAIAAVLACLIGSAAPALAAPTKTHPSVTFKFKSARVNANAKPTVEYSSSHVPAGSILYLQRDFGTKHVFKNVKKLVGQSGSVAVPGVAMGRYLYRLVAVRSKKDVAVSSTRSLFSYGKVTIAQLCRRSRKTDFRGADCGPGTDQVGSSVFNYAAQDQDGNDGPNQDAAVQAQDSSCRAISITEAVSNDDAQEQGTTSQSVQLTQSAADALGATSPVGTIGAFSAHISSGSWDLEFYTDSGGNTVDFNGSLQCWSASGDA